MPRTASRSRRRTMAPRNSKTTRTVRRTPIESESGGTRVETTYSSPRRRTRTVERREPIATGGSQFTSESESEDLTQPSSRRRPIRSYSPTAAGEKVSGGVGLLEAEFIGSLLLLILLMFASSESYGNKIMSIMKRGTLISLLFFILALIAGTGPNAAKIAKALGGLVFVGILLTAPVGTVLTDVDKVIKKNWVGSTEHGTDVGSADQGTQSSSGGESPLGAASGALQRISQIIGTFGLGFIK